MGYGECEKANPSCKYFERPPVVGGNTDNGCRTDTDHIYGRGRTPLEKDFAESPLAQVQRCRQEHDDINAEYVHWDMPDVDFIVSALRAINYQPKRRATKRLLGSYGVKNYGE